MHLIRNLNIGPRIALVFSVIIAIYAAVSAVSVWSANRLAIADAWNKHTYEVIVSSDGMLEAMINMETGARGFLLSGSEAALEPLRKGEAEFSESLQDARRLTADNPVQQARLAQMSNIHATFRSVLDENIALRRAVTAGQSTTEEMIAEFIIGKDKVAMDGFRALASQFRGAESQLLTQRAAEAEQLRSFSRNAIFIGAGCAVAVAIFAGLWLARSVIRPVSHAVAAIRAIAGGDLTVEVTPSSNDEVGQLLRALGDMTHKLSGIVGSVRMASDRVAGASALIAKSNGDLAARTEGQASALEQTAASMEELGSTVRHNAEHAASANRLAAQASTIAVTGGEVVAEVVDTMKSINSSSQQISEIISVIDSIAFQTNILALNAAVEAARAGEQGRGFAVVASEVRGLAQRSAQAAHEIKSLISASVARVDAGCVLVDKAGSTMVDVVDSIRKVSSLMTEISGASAEQSDGVAQVSEAVVQMDQATQQNAALVQDMATAAVELRGEAERLVDAVSVFTLVSDAGAAGSPARPERDSGTRAPQRVALGLARLADASETGMR